MQVLAIDTASPHPALALLGDRDDVAVELLPAGHAERLAERVQALLARTGGSLRDLSCIAVLSGPGSFTGLRAGTAFARGLARALDVPIVSFGTFVAAFESFPVPENLDLVLDAGRGEVHHGRRRDGVIHVASGPIARDAAPPALDLGVERPVLAVALARLARRDASATPLAITYGRQSAAEEKLEKRDKTAG